MAVQSRSLLPSDSPALRMEYIFRANLLGIMHDPTCYAGRQPASPGWSPLLYLCCRKLATVQSAVKPCLVSLRIRPENLENRQKKKSDGGSMLASSLLLPQLGCTRNGDM